MLHICHVNGQDGSVSFLNQIISLLAMTPGSIFITLKRPAVDGIFKVKKCFIYRIPPEGHQGPVAGAVRVQLRRAREGDREAADQARQAARLEPAQADRAEHAGGQAQGAAQRQLLGRGNAADQAQGGRGAAAWSRVPGKSVWSGKGVGT